MPKGKVDVQRQIPELSAAGIFRKCKQRLNSATTLIVMVFLFVWLQQHLGAWLSVWNQQMNAQLHVCDGRAGHTHEETVGTREHENQHDCLHESPFLCDWSRLSVCTQACMSLRSICKCMCLYIDVCRCACLRVELHASTGGAGLIRRKICCPEGRIPSRHLSLHFALPWLWPWQIHFHHCFHPLLASGYRQSSAKPPTPCSNLPQSSEPRRDSQLMNCWKC